MRTRYKQWAVDYLENNPNIVIDKLDLNSDFFKRPAFQSPTMKRTSFLGVISRRSCRSS